MIKTGMIGMSKLSREYINHFNQQSEQYSLCRPEYPDVLFDYLAQLVDANATVWDCGTGTGQAAQALARRFSQVIATDINQAQLDSAIKMNNIDYRCCPADKTTIKTGSIQLTTVAQALHWFDFSLFYQEVRRVSCPNAVIAAWCYSLGTFNDAAIDALIKTLYYDILGKEFWPAERFYIDEHYSTIPFPFVKQHSPTFSIEKTINFSQLIGYLLTWSAVKEYALRQGKNPLELIHAPLAAAWGDVENERIMHWPLHCLLAKVHEH